MLFGFCALLYRDVFCALLYRDVFVKEYSTASIEEWVESMTSNPVTSLEQVWSMGDALVV